jgi:hypothetical protein
MKRYRMVQVFLLAIISLFAACNAKGPLPSPDAVPPTVSSTIPAEGSLNVPVNLTRITIVFSEAMDPSTINETTVALEDPGGIGTVPVSVTITDPAGTTVELVPSIGLKPATHYQIVVAAGVKDRFGNALAAFFIAAFDTGTAADTIAPAVTGTTPVAGGIGVGVNTAISATFSEPVDQASIAFSLSAGGVPVDGSLTYSGTTAIFAPLNILDYNTWYTATVSAGLRDQAGNVMPDDYFWSFRTGMAPDATPPTVTAAIPATDVSSVDAVISVMFSEPVNPPSIDFSLRAAGGGPPVAGSLVYSDMTATFRPSVPLNYSTLYTGKVSAGVQDLAGNTMTDDYSWSFTTAPDATPPAVLSTTPFNDAADVPAYNALSATFSEPVDQASILFTLTDGTTPVSCSIIYSNTTAIFTPSSMLMNGTSYTAAVAAGVQDLAGNVMTDDHVWTFTTQ